MVHHLDHHLHHLGHHLHHLDQEVVALVLDHQVQVLDHHHGFQEVHPQDLDHLHLQDHTHIQEVVVQVVLYHHQNHLDQVLNKLNPTQSPVTKANLLVIIMEDMDIIADHLIGDIAKEFTSILLDHISSQLIIMEVHIIIMDIDIIDITIENMLTIKQMLIKVNIY